MNLARRLSFFLFGISIGLILVFAFFGKRSFFESYLPNKRVLNSIKKKELLLDFKKDELSYDLQPYCELNFIKNFALENGKIVFSKSFPRKKPFPTYFILYKDLQKQKEFSFYIENQTTKALIKSINKNH